MKLILFNFNLYNLKRQFLDLFGIKIPYTHLSDPFSNIFNKICTQYKNKNKKKQKSQIVAKSHIILGCDQN